MTKQTAAGYPEPKIHTLAQIVVTINGQAHKWGWADALLGIDGSRVSGRPA